jgi:hypothetical protein
MCAVDFWMDLIIGCAVFVPPALCCRCKFLPVFSLPVFRSPRNLCLAIYYRAALVSSAPWLWPVSKGVCCRSRQVFSPAVHPHVDRATVFLLWISNRIIFRLAGSVFFILFLAGLLMVPAGGFLLPLSNLAPLDFWPAVISGPCTCMKSLFYHIFFSAAHLSSRGPCTGVKSLFCHIFFLPPVFLPAGQGASFSSVFSPFPWSPPTPDCAGQDPLSLPLWICFLGPVFVSRVHSVCPVAVQTEVAVTLSICSLGTRHHRHCLRLSPHASLLCFDRFSQRVVFCSDRSYFSYFN